MKFKSPFFSFDRHYTQFLMACTKLFAVMDKIMCHRYIKAFDRAGFS